MSEQESDDEDGFIKKDSPKIKLSELKISTDVKHDEKILKESMDKIIEKIKEITKIQTKKGVTRTASYLVSSNGKNLLVFLPESHSALDEDMVELFTFISEYDEYRERSNIVYILEDDKRGKQKLFASTSLIEFAKRKLEYYDIGEFRFDPAYYYKKFIKQVFPTQEKLEEFFVEYKEFLAYFLDSIIKKTGIKPIISSRKLIKNFSLPENQFDLYIKFATEYDNLWKKSGRILNNFFSYVDQMLQYYIGEVYHSNLMEIYDSLKSNDSFIDPIQILNTFLNDIIIVINVYNKITNGNYDDSIIVFMFGEAHINDINAVLKKLRTDGFEGVGISREMMYKKIKK